MLNSKSNLNPDLDLDITAVGSMDDFYTPRQRRDGRNSFGTICECVCLTIMGERTDIPT